MLVFRSEEHARDWREARGLPGAAVLSLEQGCKLARAWYRNKLDPQWRRHTPEEAETLFRELGLAGEFWRLRG